ncbi:MAG: hypothetical protein VR73_05510 [Gammaproteobacteria bacterium BRH_c0]|nr:MAG: hypothetical protein VR73_05510 [Gammaproteobacteria bacterium BRH_c0]
MEVYFESQIFRGALIFIHGARSCREDWSMRDMLRGIAQSGGVNKQGCKAVQVTDADEHQVSRNQI